MNPYDLPVDRRPIHDPGPEPKAPEFRASSAATLLPTTVSASAAAALQWFIDNDGLAEQPDGSNHVPGVTDRCGLGNVAWCAEAVSIALMAGGFGDLDAFTMEMPGLWTRYSWGWAYCPDIVQAFRDAGRWHLSGPLPGDVVLFDWGGDNWADHVGLVEQDLGDGTVLCREGNADNRVTQKRRSVADILGYGRPPYSDTEEDDLTPEQAKWLRDLHQAMSNAKEGTQPDPHHNQLLSRLNDIAQRLDKLALASGGLPDQVSGSIVIEFNGGKQ